MTDLAPHLSVYLLEHLPRNRGASRHTINSYAYSFQLLIGYAAKRLRVRPSEIQIEKLDAELILDFLDHIEADRANTPRTRNARLAAFKSFFRFLEHRAPACLDVALRVHAIPSKRFEQQLIGMGAGETRTVTVQFPNNYLSEKLAGKTAVFEVTAKSIETPGELTVDDAFAKSLGLESLDKLKDAIKDRLTREHAGASRQKVKRVLLDRLDELHKFQAPPTLIEDEFNNVWKTVLSDLESQNKTFADEGTTEDKAREEYRTIADRRVRLGLVLAEIGEKNKVTDEELGRAAAERARQFPGQEQQVWEYYRKNPLALASMRAPIYEEKVVDFLLELASVTDKPVSREELFKAEDDEEAGA